METLTGTPRLIRLAFRRDRLVLTSWVVVIAALAGAITFSVAGLYTSEADRVAAASFSAANVIVRVFDGPAAGAELGALVLMEGYWLLAVLIGFMAAQAVVRHTRLDEETGRAELVGAAVVGRHAPLVAALTVAGVAACLAGGAVVGVLLAAALPLRGALLAGLTLAGNGMVVAAAAAIAAQVAASARAANGAAAAVIGLAFLLRAAGDAAGRVGDDGVSVISAWPSWLSPIGWGQQARAFGDERWVVLALFAACIAVLVAVALALVERRDLGAGLRPPRPGPHGASAWLTSPLGLAWRLQRGPLIAWLIGMAVVGAAFGAVGDGADELLAVSDDLAAVIEGLAAGGELVELYFAFAVGFLAIAASGYPVQALLRVRSEELSGRVEAVFATAVSRRGWLAAHLVIAAGGTLLLLATLGVSGTLAYGGLTGDWSTAAAGMLGGALAYLPAALALGGLVVLAVCVVPRASAAIGWSAFTLSLVLGQLGALFGLPDPVLDLSPFTHIPAVPAEPLAWTPLVVLTAGGALLTTVALLLHDRRDVVLAS